LEVFDGCKYIVEQRLDNQDPQRISVLLKELMSMVVQQSAGEIMAVMCQAGLSLPQIVALHSLRKCGPLSISAIAEKLNLSLAATSHLVERMVQQGLVVRNEDTIDRRQKRVAITAAGQAVLERLVQARLREVTNILSGLPPDLRVQLEKVLEQVVEELKQPAVAP
jgi:DNA-binding MarR family transcriptional regulator